MAIKRSAGENIFNFFNVIFMFFIMVITLYPLLHVAFASFSKPALLMAHKGVLLHPEGFSLESYKAVFENPNIVSGYINTIIIVVGGVAINIFMTALGAYFLSRKRLMFRNHVMFFIVFTMYFGGGLIPSYLVVKSLGLYNTLLALMIPGAIHTTNLIIMRTAFAAVPDSLEESAKIDGATNSVILFRILIPLTMPTIAVMILYYGVAHWNSWFSAMIFLRERELFPLQLILREILIQNDTNMMANAGAADSAMIGETIRYAVIIVATLPILALYPFLQRFFVKGVMVGSLKG